MFTDMILERDKDIYMESFNVKEKELKKKQLLTMIVAVLITIGIGIVYNGLLFGLPVGAFIAYKIPYVSLVIKKSERDKLNSYLFLEWVGTFRALLPSSGNVYQALKESVSYTQEPLKGKLEELVDNLGYTNSRDFYTDFADYVGNSDAHMIMDMIYQFTKVGVSEKSLDEMTNLINNLQINKMDEVITSKMSRMENVALMPIVISLITTGGFIGVIFIHFWLEAGI